MKLTNSLIVLDLETTGTWLEKDKIVEIAMIKTNVDGSRETFHEVLNPEIPIPPFVSELIGISDEDVKGKPLFKDIGQRVLDFIGTCDLAGFNVERFDLPLLQRELIDAGFTFSWQNYKVFDAQKVYHLNQKRDLTAAYQFYCRKNLDNAHSALADTEATLEIISAQVQEYGEGDQRVDVLHKFNYKPTSEFYDDDRKFRWWNGKLYLMFGKYAKQLSLQDLVKKDREYCEWILSANFSDEVKDLIGKALSGHFPVQETVKSETAS